MVEHQTVVAGEVGFAFHAVEQQEFGLGILGRHELYMRGEAGTAHTDNTHILDPLNDSGAVQGDFAFDFGAAVDAFFPFVALHIYKDGGFGIVRSVRNVGDFVHRAADGRMHHCAQESVVLGEHGAHFHLIAFRHNGLRGGSEVLAHHHADLLGQGQNLGGSFGVEFLVVGMHPTYIECFHIL